MLPPLALITAVLGSILAGYATPTEAAAIGALGATLLSIAKGQLNFAQLKQVAFGTTEITSMVFLILIGASLFSLVFRGFGGEALIEDALHSLPGGVLGAFLVVMLVIFLLGFILDFIEIIFVVVPIVGPILLAMGLDPVWLGVMFAINLQTSFLTPPFGFSLFYLRGVTPRSVPTSVMYKGAAFHHDPDRHAGGGVHVAGPGDLAAGTGLRQVARHNARPRRALCYGSAPATIGACSYTRPPMSAAPTCSSASRHWTASSLRTSRSGGRGRSSAKRCHGKPSTPNWPPGCEAARWPMPRPRTTSRRRSVHPHRFLSWLTSPTG